MELKYLRPVLLLALLACASAHANVRYVVSGLGQAEADNVQAYLQAAKLQLGEEPVEARIERFKARVLSATHRALQPFGYYGPALDTRLERNGSDWTAHVHVQPGEPVRWRTLDVQVDGEAGNDEEFRKLLAGLPMQAGGRAIHDQYEQTKNSLRRLAAERGYLDASFVRKDLLVQPSAGVADVHLHMHSGGRYRFGELQLEQDVIHDELLRRYVDIPRGEHFSSARLLAAKQALYATDFFSNVDLLAEPAEAVEGEVPVHLRAQRGKRHRYGIGLGYGTDTGYRVSGQWVMRRVNKSGHSLAFDARYSPIKWTFNSTYSIPIGNPALERITLSAGTADEQLADLNSRRVYGAYAILKVPGDWQRQTSLTALDETSNLVTRKQYDEYWVPAFRVLKTWSDRKLGAQRGLQILADLEGSMEELGLQTDYLQARVRTRLLLPLWDNGSLFMRGEAGSTWTQEFDLLPASRRFFAGGDDSVRGYGFNDLSPIDPDGVASGGKHLLAGSIEYSHRIRGPWGIAVFTDAGNALNTSGDQIKVSAGLGLRWLSPVGMVRIDLAKSLSDTERGPRLHVSVGPEF